MVKNGILYNISINYRRGKSDMISTSIEKISKLDRDVILDKQQLSNLNKQELIEKILNLQDEKKIQEDFFLNISHDLRSPLNVILSAMQCYDDIKSNDHLSLIKRNCYKMLKLINNLIDTTRLYRKYYNLNLVNIDIISLIEGNIELIDKYAKQKDISLIFDTNIEECIMGVDPDEIDRIITNLISNSIKFSPEKSNIYINVWSGDHEINISIKDEGIGIPLSKQKNIFNRFIQSTKNRDSEQKGSGIGLDLVKYLTEAHNGTVDLISEENKGCEFILRFPIRKIQNNLFKSREMKSTKKVEILDIEFSDIYL